MLPNGSHNLLGHLKGAQLGGEKDTIQIICADSPAGDALNTFRAALTGVPHKRMQIPIFLFFLLHWFPFFKLGMLVRQ